jgi:hypothetical protein
MLLYDYLPGQEEANLDFVRQRAMGDYEEVPISRSFFFMCLYIYMFVRQRSMGDFGKVPLSIILQSFDILEPP